MIKLIASDIDGTLVPDGGNEVPAELHEVILKLRAKGIQFAAASGRQWVSIESIFDPVKEKIFYLSDNGAYIGCHGRNLFLNPIERKTAMDMVEDVRKTEGLEVMLSGPDVVYLETKDMDFIDWMVNSYKFRVEMVEDLTKVESEFIKVSVYRKTDVESHTRLLREIQGPVKDYHCRRYVDGLYETWDQQRRGGKASSGESVHQTRRDHGIWRSAK